MTNIAESVVQLSGDLATVKSLYTPEGDEGWQVLDEEDADFGSGGVMLLPPQTGQPTNIAVAAGKVGIMYVLNADNLGNGKKMGGKAYSTANVGSCWCGPSYYMGSDGFGRVVSSGNNLSVCGASMRRAQAEAGLEAAAGRRRWLAVPRLLHLGLVERHAEEHRGGLGGRAPHLQ